MKRKAGRPARTRGGPPSGGRGLLAVLRALGDGTRLAIFRLVSSGRRPVCVRNVADRLAVSQPTVSHHLKVLRGAGLVAVTRRGTSSWISPLPAGLDPIRRAVAEGPGRSKGARR